MLARGAIILALALLLAACAATPTPPPPNAITLGEARSLDGAALWPAGDGLMAAWVGSDDANVFQVARPVDADATPVVLPLPPRHPFAQQALPARSGRGLIFWLDAGDDDANHLYAALLGPDLNVERGPVAVSDVFTQRYAVAPAPDGGAFVAWSGGLAAEPALYTQRVDADGRPLAPARVALDADWPALATHDDTPLLFWLDRVTGDLWRASFDGSDAARLTGGVRLAPGDRIIGVGAAHNGQDDAFFWNITRADGSDESWLVAGPAHETGWPAPQRLMTAGEPPLPARWLAFPPGGDGTTAAAQVGASVGLLALHSAAFTPLAALSSDLIGRIHVAEPSPGRFAVSWAEPGPQTATLRVAFTP